MPKQLWKTKIGYIRLSDVGKSLAHYRLAATTQHRGQKVHTISIERLKSFLIENAAVLVQEEMPQSTPPAIKNLPLRAGQRRANVQARG